MSPGPCYVSVSIMSIVQHSGRLSGCWACCVTHIGVRRLLLAELCQSTQQCGAQKPEQVVLSRLCQGDGLNHGWTDTHTQAHAHTHTRAHTHVHTHTRVHTQRQTPPQTHHYTERCNTNTSVCVMLKEWLVRTRRYCSLKLCVFERERETERKRRVGLFHSHLGNMNLISLSAEENASLPCSAFRRSEVPYLARRLWGHIQHGCR